MALNLVNINDNFSGLTGVYAGQNNNPVFLGKKNESIKIDTIMGNEVGIGFDTRFSPAQVRIYFDANDPLFTGYYGLVMTKELIFDGPANSTKRLFYGY